MVRKSTKKMVVMKKQDGGILPMLLSAVAPSIIQGIAGALSGRGMMKKKGGRKMK